MKKVLEKHSNNFKIFNEFPSYTDPNVLISGVNIDNCWVFKSKAKPLKIKFIVSQSRQNDFVKQNLYEVMYKNGDDVRQDMFFLKMIELISEILDYKEYATTYKVVAFSQNDGMLEIVP